MPIHGYPGNIITANPTAPTVSSASGVWTTEQQLINQSAGNWPMGLTQISRSLRFNSADSAYLNRTPASAGNRKTWTFSCWFKKTANGVYHELLSASPSGGGVDQFFFSNNDTLSYYFSDGTVRFNLATTQVFRDPSAWYHIVLAVDTTQATSTDRAKIYINGTQITALSATTYAPQNQDTYINGAYLTAIGAQVSAGAINGLYPNGYLAEVNFIDGLALTPAYFGFNNSDTGVWSPKQYIGSYGTNGFYLNFSDNSGTTSTTLGKDYSGNGNNWTPNNFSVTAGAGNDSLVDSPTSYGTDTGVGGEVRGNYCTANPLDAGSGFTFTNGNLDYTNSTDNRHFRCTFAMPNSGKYYWEVTITASPSNHGIALIKMNSSLTQGAFASDDFRGYTNNGTKYSGAGSVAYGNSWTTNDVIGVAVDMDSGKIWFSKNGTFQASGDPAAGTNAAFTDIASTGYIWMPGVNTFSPSTNSGAINFGQRAFAYTAPSGFKALCTQNLPTPTIGATSTTQADNYFDIVLRNGFGTSGGSITSVQFQPDFIWEKRRTAANHQLVDSVRGVTKYLSSNLTDAEATYTTYFTSFNSNGYTLGAGDYGTGDALVDWIWRAGGTAVTNTAGTITSTVSANTTSGFSIVRWVGTAANATVGHGLGAVPSMLIIKERGVVDNWAVYHVSVGNQRLLNLNSTNAQSGTSAAYWNNTTPTSTVFSVGTDNKTNGSNAAGMICYAFAPVAGYSAFGSYTGNGSSTDGPFVYTGFRPRFFLVKDTTSANDWLIYDTARNTYNLAGLELFPNSSAAEATGNRFDILSNGFKSRGSGGAHNTNGNTYIYAAFAEAPFKFSLAR